MFKLVVLSVVLAAVAADPSALWGTGLAAPLAAGWGAPWAAGVAAPWGAPLAAPVAAPLAAPVAAVAPGHWIKKRSVVSAPLVAAPVATPLTWGRSWVGPAAPVAAAPLAWGRSWVGAAAPVAVAAPVAPWGLGLGARVGRVW